MKKIATALVLSTLLTAGAFAASPADVEKRIRSLYPATTIHAVRAAPVKGFYEVVMGKNVAYTDENGRYMVFGHLFDMQEQVDLTAGVIEEFSKVDVARLPVRDALKKIKGKGERILYVFSDQDCPYCKKLEGELAKIDNVTIYTFPMPLAALHPDAARKSRLMWCAKDQVKAWDEFMSSGKLPQGSDSCDNPVERNVALAQSLGINGTPTIIFANGKLAPGALPAVEIERRLSEKAATSAVVVTSTEKE